MPVQKCLLKSPRDIGSPISDIDTSNLGVDFVIANPDSYTTVAAHAFR